MSVRLLNGLGSGSPHLPQACAAVFAVASVIAVFHETAAAIVTIWYRSGTFSHAFLVIPICLYLVWRQRRAAAMVPMRPSLWGVAAVAVAAMCWLAGHVAGTMVVQQISVVCIVQGVILAMFGWELCWVFAFPLLYLFFAVPMGEGLVPPLQDVTAAVAIALVRAAGVPVFVDGNFITIPTGNFYVAEACSGIRYLIASVAIGILFAGTAYRTWWRRVGFVAISIAVPIVANGIRAFGIIFLAYVSGNEIAVGVDHLIYGWLFFTAVTACMLGLGMAMREGGGDRWRADQPLPPPNRSQPLRPLVFSLVLALLPVLTVRAYAYHIDSPKIARSFRLQAPALAAPWSPIEAVKDPLAPRFASPDTQLDAAYGDGSDRVYLHVGYYFRQTRGSEAVSSDHTLIDRTALVTNAMGRTSADIGGEALSVQFVRATSSRQHGRLAWYWYWIDGRFIGDPYLAKVLQVKAKLFGGDQAAAIIMVTSDYDERPEDAERALRSFMSRIEGLAGALAQARPDEPGK